MRDGNKSRPRALLVMTPSTYRATDFLAGGRAAGVDVVVGTSRAQALSGLAPEHNLTLPFDDRPRAIRRAREYHARHPLAAVVAVDDDGVLLAAELAAALGVGHNSVAAVAGTRSKIAMRRRLASAGLPSPAFLAGDGVPDPEAVARHVGFPCVVKPAALSGSRGVLRVDRPGDLAAAWRRVAAIQETALAEERHGVGDRRLLCEAFLPGREICLEGLLQDGRLRVLALFDKPDPMDGPAFPETIFVTPSRLPAPVQDAVADLAARAAGALDLQDGPIHAEFRVDGERVHLLEMAARTIGGLCSRALRFGTGMSLEEIVLRHACRRPLAGLVREEAATGVLMLPVPAAGRLREVAGQDAARAVAGVTEIVLTVSAGTDVRPLPDESRPLGFVFARGGSPAAVEAALRSAQERLVIHIEPLIP